jgi:AmpD protein
MIIDIAKGLLNGVVFYPSPNFDERPNQDIDLLVIHGISLPPGEFGTDCVKSFFLNQLNPALHPYFEEIGHIKVSAHLFITRTGEAIQFVPFNRRAWHAGASEFQGQTNCNDFSIGIELEGTDEIPYTIEQYQQLARITYLLMQAYPNIVPERIVGHCDIAPQRKTDPGCAFDWAYYKQLLTNLLVNKPKDLVA